jgi:hypothetical protein
VEVQLHALLTSALDWAERSASRPSRFIPGKESLVHTGQETGWPPNLFWTRWRGEKLFLASAGTRNPDHSTVAQLYTTELTRLPPSTPSTVKSRRVGQTDNIRIKNFCGKTSQKSGHLEDLNRHGRITLRWTWGREVVRMRDGWPKLTTKHHVILYRVFLQLVTIFPITKPWSSQFRTLHNATAERHFFYQGVWALEFVFFVPCLLHVQSSHELHVVRVWACDRGNNCLLRCVASFCTAP